MFYLTLITAQDLAAQLLSASPPVVLDCRSAPSDSPVRSSAYGAGHLSGARHVSLQQCLSGARTGRNGRNPLPDADVFRSAMGALGVGDDTQVIAYDNSGGLYAARLWWMLRWIGHATVGVLDGGLAAWHAAGQPVTRALPPSPRPMSLSRREPLASSAGYEDLRAQLAQPRWLVLDARAPDCFRGENEVLDAAGGHIPGARNRPYPENLDATGCFKRAAQLREEFDALLGGRPAPEVVNQCGSGVSACHNLLAMEVAGLPGAALYPGSWSEWSAQLDAAITTGGS